MAMFHLPVAIHTHTISTPHGVKIVYPSVSGLANHQAQEHINRTIAAQVELMRQEQKKYQSGTLSEMTGHYEIKTNERGILSMTLSNYAYSSPMAHGYTIVKALTFNVLTGKPYSLGDLFKPGSDYVGVLSSEVATQIKERNLPLLNGFTAISPNQDYYLADKSIVIFFQLYEITPYYVGFPMFPISVYDVLSIAAEPGPLSDLAADIA
jgi:hypothetical protein